MNIHLKRLTSSCDGQMDRPMDGGWVFYNPTSITIISDFDPISPRLWFYNDLVTVNPNTQFKREWIKFRKKKSKNNVYLLTVAIFICLKYYFGSQY